MASEGYSKPLPPPPPGSPKPLPPAGPKPARPPPPPGGPKPALRGAVRGRGIPPRAGISSPNLREDAPPLSQSSHSADSPPPRPLPPRARPTTNFPSTAPPPRQPPATAPLPSTSVEPKEHKSKRTYIVEEILETERTYVNGLNGLLQEFDKPLARVIKPEETRTIFSNIHALLGMHKLLLDNLQDRMNKWSEQQVIGDVLAQLIPFLKMYSTYINAFDTTNGLIEKLKKKNNDFRLLLPTCKHGIHEGDLGLSSLLLTPIQRIPRYVLLLKDLQKNTDPGHPDFDNLQKACDAIQAIASEINERKRRDEQSKRIATLSTEISKALHNSPHNWFRHKTERELPCDVCKKVIVAGKKCYSCDVCGQNTHLDCHKKDGICGDEDENSSLVKHNRTYVREGPAEHRKITLSADGISTNKFAKEVKEKRDCLVFLFNDSLLVVYVEQKKKGEGAPSSPHPGAKSDETSYKLCSMIRWHSTTTGRDVRFERITPTSLSIYPPREYTIHTLIWKEPKDLESWWEDINKARAEWAERAAEMPEKHHSGTISSSNLAVPSSSQPAAELTLPASSSTPTTANFDKMFTIPATAPVPGSGGKFTAYVILINEPGKESRSILKRYSQLFDLHQALKKLGIPKKSLPKFPAKKWIGNTDPKFVKKRREKLQAYLNGLSPQILNLPLLKRFLTTGVDESVSTDDAPGADFFVDTSSNAQEVCEISSDDDDSELPGSLDDTPSSTHLDSTPRHDETPTETPLCTATALYNFIPESNNELAFNQSDILEIWRKDPDGWWFGFNTRTAEYGDIPATYVREEV